MTIHQITRVPIVGPHPYNTLVYVGGTLDAVGSLDPVSVPEIGKTGRASIIYRSQFKLIGWDPRTSPLEVPHSTTIVMDSLGPQQNCTFEAAYDSVRYAGFDPHSKTIPADGRFYYVIDIGLLFSRGLSANCLQLGIESSDPTSPPFSVCALYEFPFSFQVSSYFLVWEPDPPKQPAQWGNQQPHPTKIGKSREAAERLSDKQPAKVGRALLQGGRIALSSPSAKAQKPGCNCE